MIAPLLVGASLIVLTVLIQGLGSVGLMRLLFRHHMDDSGHVLPKRALGAIIMTATGLLLLHCLQILVWAVAYRVLTPVQPIENLETAVYFSAVSFTTVGYGDITLSDEQWRLLAGFEALNGVLLLGWSTALLYAVVHRTWSGYAARHLMIAGQAHEPGPIRQASPKPSDNHPPSP